MMPHQQRLQQLQMSISNNACDALLIENTIDLFYLTGIELSTGQLLASSQNIVLIVDKRYFEYCQKCSPITVWDAENYSLNACFATPEFSSTTALGFNSSKTIYKDFLQLQKLAEAKSFQLVPIESPLQNLRAIKDETELQLLQEAGNLGSLGFDFVLSLLREGITELEIANELEIFWKKHGSKGLAFDPIIAFGTNSSMPHYRAGNAQLQHGNIVLIDIGVNLHHYHSDMTRTVFFGSPHPKLAEIHEIVQQAQAAALALCRPGTNLAELDNAARELIAAHSFGPQFSHSLGHGVGLEIHEYPTIKNIPPYASVPLAPGMVITIEPGIYLPELGGVRIEDTIAITKDGYLNLTNRPISPAL
jgi:Xaa-Pro aminopeptidase